MWQVEDNKIIEKLYLIRVPPPEMSQTATRDGIMTQQERPRSSGRECTQNGKDKQSQWPLVVVVEEEEEE